MPASDRNPIPDGTRVRIRAQAVAATVATGTAGAGVWLRPDPYTARGIGDLFGPYASGDLEILEDGPGRQ